MSDRYYTPEIESYEPEAYMHCRTMNTEIRNKLKGRDQVHLNNYGWTAENPIYSLTSDYTELYLKRICTQDMENFTWQWKAAVLKTCHGVDNVRIDIYSLFLRGQAYRDIYLVENLFPAKFPPAGLRYSDIERDWTLERHAYMKGISPGTLKIMIEAEQHHENRLREKCRKISEVYPDFDFDKEYSNRVFKQLLDYPFDPLQIFRYVHKDRLLKRRVNASRKNNQTVNPSSYKELIYEAEKSVRQSVSIPDNDTLAKEAEEKGLRPEDYRKIKKMAMAESGMNWRKILSQLDDAANEAKEVHTFYPDFDPREEYKNPLFVKMIRNVSMLTAYEMIHFQELFVEKNNVTEKADDILIFREKYGKAWLLIAKDKIEGYQLMKELSDDGYDEASVAYSMLVADSKERVKLLKKASDKHNAEGMWEYCMYLKQNSYNTDEWLNLCIRAAEANSVDAMNELGNFFHRKANYPESMYWYAMARANGHAQGEISMQGIAREWVRKGSPRVYLDGTPNYNRSRFLCSMAYLEMYSGLEMSLTADALVKMVLDGEPIAGYLAGEIFENLNNDEMAFKIYNALAFEHDAHALKCYADMCLTGKGTEKDIPTAVKLYEEAAMLGERDAMFIMGEFTRNESRILAAYWYGLAHTRGHRLAWERLKKII